MSCGALACKGNGSGIVINADDLPVSSHEITQQKRNITRTATYVQIRIPSPMPASISKRVVKSSRLSGIIKFPEFSKKIIYGLLSLAA